MIPGWFEKKWVDDESKALGLFLAILSLRLDYPYDISRKKMLYYPFSSFKEAVLVRLEGNELYKSYAVGTAFFEKLYENEKNKKGILDFSRRIEVLDKIEEEYSEVFRKAYLRCIDYRRIGKETTWKIQRLLKDISAGVYGERFKTLAGSIRVEIHPLEVKTRMGVLCGEAIHLLYLLNASNIASYMHVYPFPVLEKSFIESLK